MIEAVIFDLDGTLIQTERLKAISYAREAVEMCLISLEEGAVIEALREVVGRSRRHVTKTFVQRFDLAEKAMKRSQELGHPELRPNNSWQAYVQAKLAIYLEMIADPQVIAEVSGCIT